MAATESQLLLLKTIKSSFNNSSRSDVIVTINGDKFHVSAPLLEVQAPTLFAELTVLTAPTLSSEATVTEQQMATHLSSLITQTMGKRVVTIVDPELKRDVVLALLEYMYDKPVDVTLANASDIYVAATRFGMKEFVQKVKSLLHCSLTMTSAHDIYVTATKLGMNEIAQKAEKLIKDSVMETPTETFLEAYAKAMETKNPLTEKDWKSALVAKLAILPQEEVLKFTSKMSCTDLVELINSPDLKCEEDLIYEIGEKWCRTKEESVGPRTKQCLMSYIKLELLSGTVLVTKAKVNPDVSQEAYTQAWEKVVMSVTDARPRRRNGLIFALGKITGTYGGYRLVTKDEVKTVNFLNWFAEYYEKYNGIFCLDTFLPNIVCCADHVMCLLRDTKDSWLKTAPVTKDTFTKLRTDSHTPDDIKQKIMSIYVSANTRTGVSDDAGLFVLIGTKFI
jgi:hypothetical protein